MKYSGVEWIGDIPDDWEIFTLKQLTNTHFGGCWGEEPKGDEFDALCVRIADFNYANQTVNLSASTIRNYTEKQLEKTLQDGDLIVEKSGGGDKTPVGRVVLFEARHFPDRTMFANFSECLRLKSKTSKKYIAYHLKTLYYSYDMHYYFNQTTGLQNLDMTAYLSTKLCYPSLPTQQKIAEYLDKKCGQVDGLIANQQAQIEKLKQYKQSVITEAVTRGLNHNVPLKDSGIDWIGSIPENWEVVPIRAVFDENINKNIDGTITNALQFKFGEIVRKKNFVAEDDKYVSSTILSYYIVQKDMIIINGLNLNYDFVTQRVGLVKETGIITSAYLTIVIKDKEKVSPKYANYLFKSYDSRTAFHNMGKGIRKVLNFNELRLNLFLLPPFAEQQKIVTYLDNKCGEIDRLISLKQQKIDTLTSYKKSLIYEYVTGKKEVV